LLRLDTTDQDSSVFLPLMSQSTLEDQFFDFDRLMSLGVDEEYPG
jgi:hypothetical protein